jgi:hypothetical protein
VESLALVVAIIIYGLLLSGPLSLALSSRTAKRLTEQLALKILRRIVMGLVNFFGISISVFFVTGPFPIVLKAICILCFLLNVWALDREYGGYLTNSIKSKFRRNPNGPAGQS